MFHDPFSGPSHSILYRGLVFGINRTAGAGTLLHEFLASHRAAIVGRTRTRAAVRVGPGSTADRLAGGIAAFLDQLIEALRGSAPGQGEMDAGAARQGDEMLRMGFTIGEVVHAYGDLGHTVRELIFECNAPIIAPEVHTLNQCIDDAMANAVTEYERLREQSLVYEGTERLGIVTHELRNRLNSATLSFAVLKEGSVSAAGSTGAVLDRSLRGMATLIDGMLDDVRARSATSRRELIDVAQFVDEVQAGATIDAKARGRNLSVEPAGPGVVIEADRQSLTAAVGNLLQNAFKFSRHGGLVQLRARTTADRVLLDIEDECGGLPSGQVDDLFQPFTQRGDDRSGLGLGLPISRAAIRQDGGELRVRNVAGHGCIFTVDLPRKHAAMA